MKKWHIAFAALVAGVFAAGVADDPLSGKKTTVSGLVAFEAGEMMQGNYFKQMGEVKNDGSRKWLSRAQSNITIQTIINPYLKVVAGLEVEGLTSFYQKYSFPGANVFYYNAYITEAQGVFNYTLGRNEFKLGIGRFDFKYNEDSRDLGEYMFRSTPYPQTVWTEFDFSLVRLLGFHLEHRYNNLLDQKLLFNSATDHFPLWDWTLSYLADVNLLGIVKVGGGVSLHRMFSVNEALTRPTLHDNSQLHIPVTDRKFYIDGNGDSLMVPLCGTILMGKVSIDPKRILFPRGEDGIFGKEDLKIYSEASVLGLQNYPETDSVLMPTYAYNKFWDRVPMMFGINIPTLKLLDVFACEAEYWSNPYPNSLEDVIRWNAAGPGLQSGIGNMYDPRDYVYHWKWAFYFKKTLFNSFQAIALMANDHYFTRNQGDALSSNQDYEQAFRKNGDWYWMLKFRFLF